MDDTNKQQSVAADSQADQSTAGQPVASPSTAVSAVHKEAEPAATATLQEAPLVAASETEPVVPKEVAEIGVEATKVHEELSPDVEKLGVELAKESAKPSLQPTGAVLLPLTDKEANHILKAHKKISDSIVWLAALVVKQFKKMRQENGSSAL